MNELFTRDGHFSDLTLERSLAGEINMEELAHHLSACPLCSARLDKLREDNDAFTFTSPFEQKPTRKPGWTRYSGLIVAAAALLLYVNVSGRFDTPAPSLEWSAPSEYFRVKGGLNVEFFLKRGETVVKVKNNDPAHPGDQLGFQVSTPVAGQLMILGVDKNKKPYLCYPQDQNGQSDAFGPTTEATTINQAVLLDDTLGQEHFTAIFCETRFDLKTVSTQLMAARSHAEAKIEVGGKTCRTRTLLLNKTQATTP